MKKQNSSPCEGCRYWRTLYWESERVKACHYCFETGKLRGCDPAHCDKRVEKEPGQAPFRPAWYRYAYGIK